MLKAAVKCASSPVKEQKHKHRGALRLEGSLALAFQTSRCESTSQAAVIRNHLRPKLAGRKGVSALQEAGGPWAGRPLVAAGL